MYAKPLLLLLALTVNVFSTVDASAGKLTSCDSGSGDESEITSTLGEGKPANWWLRPCQNEECRAIHDLSCAANAYANTFHPNFMGYKSPRDGELAQAEYRHTVMALGRKHPGRISLYCKLLARVATIVTGERTAGGYDLNADYLTTFAIHLDRPGNQCLANMIAAVPGTQAAQTSMQEWAIPCLKTIRKCQADINKSLR